jgi:RimJ/RimL family protein N-acetyltransferase
VRHLYGTSDDGFTMNAPHQLRTDRLRLRRWLPTDLIPFAALNADPRVSEYLPGPLSREDSDALVARIENHFNEYGFGLWAVEICDVAPFAGFIGLSVPRFEAHFTPCVEIGWRLNAEYWGHGYATEGARAVLMFGFEVLELAEIVSFTVPRNARSRRVMEKIGMIHKASDDFDHPLLPDRHPFRRHVLYRIDRAAVAPARETGAAAAGSVPSSTTRDAGGPFVPWQTRRGASSA